MQTRAKPQLKLRDVLIVTETQEQYVNRALMQKRFPRLLGDERLHFFLRN